MPFMELTLENLKELDEGRVPVAFANSLRRLVLDCIDRPTDKRPRTATLICKVTPVTRLEDKVVELDKIKLNFQVKDKVPERVSKDYELNFKRDGKLQFSSASPENVDQTTIDDIVDPESGRTDRKPR